MRDVAVKIAAIVSIFPLNLYHFNVKLIRIKIFMFHYLVQHG